VLLPVVLQEGGEVGEDRLAAGRRRLALEAGELLLLRLVEGVVALEVVPQPVGVVELVEFARAQLTLVDEVGLEEEAFGGGGQRWVIAIKTKIQLPNTVPIILNCVIGIIH
jgi:hypothetical protein